MRAQTTTEYLFLMAVVLAMVIAIAYIVGREAQTTGIDEKQSQAYWSDATPFAVHGYRYADTLLQLDMENTLVEQATLQQIEVEEIVYNIDTVFQGGGRLGVNIKIADCGTVGSYYKLKDIVIRYQKQDGNFTQQSQRTWVGLCS